MHHTNHSVALRATAPFPYRLPLSTFSDSDARAYALNHCIAMARHDGCDVVLLPRAEGDKRHPQRALLINGKHCSFQNPANQITNKLARRPYTKVVVAHSSLSLVDFAVFLTTVEGKPPRVFVIPKDVLLRAYFTPESRYVTLWLPVDPLPPYKNRRSKVEYWSYQRA